MRFRIVLMALLVAVNFADGVQAGVAAIKAVQVPQSVLPNYVVNDLLIDFTGILRGQQLLLELEQGSLYQCPTVGTHPTWLPPIDTIINIFPPCEFDTYIGIGERKNFVQPILIVGGAVGIESGSTLQFDSAGLNVAWAPGTGVDIGPRNDFFIARITLSNDALGTLRYLGTTSAGTGDPFLAVGAISNGVISFVPEPASAWLVGLAASAVIVARRRRVS